ncbi:[weak similarity to] endonuclease [methanotrophic bacterial endosymbiont of Bathymodiolus sp.]|nr:[weak similarity to] endonuclease [methanotrophic bacterial endosymbiont of Bathymodiolus sp.]
MDREWYVYLLECKSKRIYSGVTPDLDKRLQAHAKGKGALFTKINAPEKLLAAKAFPSQRQALQIERQIKKMPAQSKRILADVWSREQVIEDV